MKTIAFSHLNCKFWRMKFFKAANKFLFIICALYFSPLYAGVPPPRPPPPTLPPASSVAQQSLPPPLERHHNPDPQPEQNWRCTACTFENHPFLDKCEICEMPRMTAASGAKGK